MHIKKNCIKCKGRLWCGLSYCPIVKRTEALFKVVKRFENLDKPEFSGSAPSVFVGRVGYPQVNVGILSTQEKDSKIYDAPRVWSERNFEIPRIINLRSGLVNSRFSANVNERSRFLEVGREVAMASEPVDMDVVLKEKPRYRVTFKQNESPMGPNASLVGVRVNENPKIPDKVDYVVSDYDFKANEAVPYLYEKGFDENFLTRLLSIGNLGVKSQRKLVPTRWAITASDDIIAKSIIEEIKDCGQIDGPAAFFGSYLGNFYLILMFPEVWSYELFETYMPRTSWNISDEVRFSTDHEGYDGRKSYAEECAGGYYSVRLAVLEKLRAMRRQAAVLALRFITDDYAVPLGVWVTREATRKSLSSEPITFETKELCLKYAKALVKKRWGYELDTILGQSVILKNMRAQTKLLKFV